jgi:NAD(P)H-hydrate epimerase
MIPVLSREQMRAFDAHAIGNCRVPSVVLMENAGRGAADVIARECRAGGETEAGTTFGVVVVCGMGNNGGDGFVVSRHLLVRGLRVEVWLIGSKDALSKDARLNCEAWVGIGGRLVEVDLGKGIQDFEKALEGASVIVDALFGTGLDRPIVAPISQVIEAINKAHARTIALDVPSGLDAETGRILGIAVRADVTTTFAHYKTGLVTPNGARRCGRIHVVDIGVPAALVAHTGHSAELLERADVAGFVSRRPADVHKHSAGHVAVFAGSPGKVGASLMVAEGALRAGAGAVTIATWPDAATSLEARVVEAMTARITVDPQSIDLALQGKHAVVIGPGFGTGDDALSVLAHVVSSYEGPIVLDADAITLLAKDPTILERAKYTPILTPHAGELARVLDCTAREIDASRFVAAREAAARTRAVVLLKGPHTLIATPDGRVAINTSGNPALATAGSGDILAGIAGALSCHAQPFDAACTAAYVHGSAADAWCEAHGGADRGMLASEIAVHVPRVLADLINSA